MKYFRFHFHRCHGRSNFHYWQFHNAVSGSVHSQQFVVLQASVIFINYIGRVGQDDIEQSHVMLQGRVQAIYVDMLKYSDPK